MKAVTFLFLILGLLCIGIAKWGNDVLTMSHWMISTWGIVLYSIFGGLFILCFLGYLIWFVLAPSNYFFTFVKEGTAKIIVIGDAFSHILIQWRGRTFRYDLSGKERWMVVDEFLKENIIKDVLDEGGASAYKKITKRTIREPRHIGGLRWVGLWPFYKVYTYDLRWHDIHKVKDGEEPVFHDEKNLDYVLLRQDIYWTKLPAAETKPGERIPVDAEFLIKMRVTNPYKAIFDSPIGWVENIINLLTPVLRGVIGNNDLDYLISLKGGEKFWNELVVLDDFKSIPKEVKEKWGIEIMLVQVKNIGMGTEYQEALSIEKKMGLEAKGRANELAMSIMESYKIMTGKTEEQIRGEINDSRTSSNVLEEMTKLVRQKLAMEHRLYLEINAGESTGLEELIIKSIATYLRMPTGEGGKKEDKKEKKEVVSEDQKKRDEEALKKAIR
jgi:regulator of protease activity HflC (stomatin/prohibitin superfamily)